ncbi:hypothetical protein ACLOJK_035457 [Asimina triloba]
MNISHQGFLASVSRLHSVVSFPNSPASRPSPSAVCTPSLSGAHSVVVASSVAPSLPSPSTIPSAVIPFLSLRHPVGNRRFASPLLPTHLPRLCRRSDLLHLVLLPLRTLEQRISSAAPPLFPIFLL